MKKSLFTLIFSFSCAITVQAQIDLTVQVAPPYTHKWQDYIGNTGKLLVTANSSLNQSERIYLAGSIQRISGGEEVSITVPPPPMGGQANPAIALTVFPGINTFTSNQLGTFFDRRGNANVVGLRNEDLVRGNIPEGTYRLCLQAYGLDGILLSNINLGCVTFPIYFANPPRISTPACGTTVAALNPQVISFTWTMPMGSQTAGTLWKYNIQMVPVPAGMEPNTAINNATNFMLNREVSTNNYLYSAADIPLIPGTTYAWRVQAIDPLGNAGVMNLGFSEVCIFVYAPEGRVSSSALWPLNNDWIPFRQIPLIARYDPYSDLYRSFTSATRVRYNGNTFGETRNLNWSPLGPRQTQQTRVGPLTNEQAAQIIVFPEVEPGLGVASPLIRGKRVDWESSITLGTQVNNQQQLLTTGFGAGFNIGMAPSELRLPANNARLAEGQIRFEWLSATPPTLIRPEYLPVTSTRVGGMNFYNSYVQEAWVLEVSRKRDFSTLVHTDRGEVGRGVSLESPESELRSALYRDLGSSKFLQDTGEYFWRVKWLLNPESTTDTTGYQYSQVRRFFIGTDTTTRQREEPIPPVRSACVASCDVDPALLQNTEENTNVQVNQIIKMGKFDMKVTQISWSGSLASGKGVISVPFMNTGLVVSFSGVKVNRNNQAISGTATADYEPQSPITSSQQSRTFAQLTGMSESQLLGLHGLYSQTSRLVSQLTASNPVKLPIGLDNDYQGTKYVIGIVGVYFTHQRATLNVLFKVDFPEADGWLSLGATDLCFHPNGMAGTGRGMLYNPLDKTIRMGETDLIFKRTVFAGSDYNAISDSGTYAQWDCDGFKVLQIKGEIHFGRDVVVPDNTDGSTGAGIVKGYFNAKVRNLRQFILDFRMDRFQSPGAPGWGFEIANASLDFSNQDNPPGFNLPSGYQNPPPQKDMWKGFYLKNFTVYVPPTFRPTSGQPRLSFGAENMFIDRTGLSAEFNVRNRIVSENECTVDGWAFGIDSIKLRILQLGHSRGEFAGNMNGKFKIPISPTSVAYRCNITTSARRVSFEILAGSVDTLSVPIWFANMQLTQTLIGFRYTEAQVRNPQGVNNWESSVGITADLSGSISINGRPRSETISPGEIQIPDLRFQNLKLSSNEPYFECPEQNGRGCVYFAHNSPQRRVGGFPVILNNVGVVARNAGADGSGVHPMEWDRAAGPRVGLRIGFSVIPDGNTTSNSGSSSTSGNNFRCTSSISFVGRMSQSGGAQWVPTGLLLDSILISGGNAAITMSGSAVFFAGDATYGDGFKGEVTANIRPGIDLKVAAQFGNKGSNRYWYADGMASMPVGIPLGPSGLKLYGFGGGAYENMRLEGQVSTITGQTGQVNRSGYRYVPSETNTIGIRATIALGAVKKEIFYGEGTMGVTIGTNPGSFQSMELSGNCRFMSTPGNNQGTAIWGDFRFVYHHPTTTFDGEVNVFVNAAAGAIRGAGSNNQAGRLAIHYDPNIWYFKLGTPENRVGIRIGIPGIPVMSIVPQAYLMAGKELPGIPDPPALVKSLVSEPAGGWGANRGQLADGFCFGASLEASTGQQTVANFVRYNLEAAIGFDVAIRNLERVSCAAANGSFTPGINGWYANGQAYAAVRGDLALKVPLPLTESFVTVAAFSAATRLEAGLVNPSWFKGELTGSLNLLGLIRIDRFSVPFQVGEKCQPIYESPLADMALISDLKPGADEREIDPFTYPAVALNFAHNQMFSLEVMDAEGRKRTESFMVCLQEFKAVDVSSGATLAAWAGALPVSATQSRAIGAGLRKTLDRGYQQGASIRFIENGYAAQLITESTLKTDANIRLSATAFSLKYVQGRWEIALKANNSPIYQDSIHTFRTGPLPARMRDEYVRFTYPYRGQRYFLQDECRAGRVELWQSGQLTTYFGNDTRSGYTTTFFARFVPIDGSGSPVDMPLTIATRAGIPTLSYDIPTLVNNKVYALMLIKKVSSGRNNTNGLTFSGSSMINQYISSGAFSRKILGPLAMGSGETAVYVLFFKTSQYNSLNQKLQANQFSGLTRTAFGIAESFTMNLGGAEGFDEFDAYPYVSMSSNNQSATYPALLSMDIPFTENWYHTFAIPYVYEMANYLERWGVGRPAFQRSNAQVPGIPPRKSVSFSQFEGYIYGKLNAAECRPYNPQAEHFKAMDFNNPDLFRFSAVLSSQVNRTFLSGGGNRNAVISYTAPTTVAFDWASVRTKCQAYTRIYGQPETSEFIPVPLRPVVRKILNNEYQMMSRGTYNIRFYYQVPGAVCQNPDFQSQDRIKSFTY